MLLSLPEGWNLNPNQPPLTNDLTGSATGTMGTWPFYGNGATDGPQLCVPPPPVLVGTH